MNGRRRIVTFLAVLTAIPAAVAIVFLALDRLYPLPADDEMEVSAEVVDRNGELLRPFATSEGRWRLAVGLQDIDPQLIAMLIAYEDKRFYRHPGIDPLATMRAAWQFLRNGRIVSGGSTLSMQLALMSAPRGERTVSRKLTQIFRALQIERQFSKDEILRRYLTLAPYGGNLEGIRAASLAYFGKEPRKLLLSEAALLVALPQSPETRRPDRHPKTARLARDRVLQRMAEAGVIDTREVERAAAAPLAGLRMQLPMLAPHLAEAARRTHPRWHRIELTLRRDLQQQLDIVARNAARRIGAKLSVAMMLADTKTGDILAEVGAASYLDPERSGWIDMTRVPRSPGSTLKPFIYGLAFEGGMATPETLISDRPTNFAGYRPENFDTSYQGDVTARQALQMSLNVPAVQLLQSVGPARLLQNLRRAGAEPTLPRQEPSGLAVGLGGLGLSLADLVQAYAALANGGNRIALTNGIYGKREPYRLLAILSPRAAWQVTDILAGIPEPSNAVARPLAYKTGTSYGYRDAWSIGFDGRYVLGVWVGRPDNGAVPGITGGGTAAPILFEAFARSGLKPEPFRAMPDGTTALARADLPEGLKRFVPKGKALVPVKGATTQPEIVYPPQDARIDLGNSAEDHSASLVLKLQGGKPPFRWIANGRPLDKLWRRRVASWLPDGPGFSRLTVIDAAGQAASVDVYIE